jgi:uncharacterized membrane protein
MAEGGKKTNATRAIDEKNNAAARELRSKLEINKSFGDRVALFITDVFGSMVFLCLCLFLFLIWILWNLNLIPLLKPFDPYPFPELEMIVSLFAIILSVSVLISQNREGKMEKISQQVEFEVNVRAENEITKVLTMLDEIQKKLGIHIKDTELEAMKENLDLHQLHQQIDEAEPKKEE